MGNSATHRFSNTTGKVILSNGAVFTYDKTVTVAELMLEHPQEVVVEYSQVANGKKSIPLPADTKLETNKLYLMLPVRRGKPALISSEEARTLLNRTDSTLRSKALLLYTGVVPFLVRGLRQENNTTTLVGKKIAFLVERRNVKEQIKSDFFADVLEGRPEFLSRQISGKEWRPSLDPIKEKATKAKVRHYWFALIRI